jgi:hypothetical protein
MAIPIATHQRAVSVSGGVLLISLGILFYTNYWWPGILLALMATVGIKEILRGRYYDVVLSTAILGGLFLFFFFNSDWAVAVPVLFTIAGIWIIFREFFITQPRTGEEAVEDASHEVAEEEEHEQ